MTVEIISWSISTKVWYRNGIELATPGSAVRHASVARHVTDCATRPGDISMSLYKQGHCLLLKKVWIYSVLLDHLEETFLGTFILNMISPCHYYLRHFSESRSSCGSTLSVHPSETLLGCLVCVIHSFLFKLCIMVVHILKMCTSYFMPISWIFSHFWGVLNFDIFQTKSAWVSGWAQYNGADF